MAASKLNRSACSLEEASLQLVLLQPMVAPAVPLLPWRKSQARLISIFSAAEIPQVVDEVAAEVALQLTRLRDPSSLTKNHLSSCGNSHGPLRSGRPSSPWT
jgi:hypothetical protein